MEKLLREYSWFFSLEGDVTVSLCFSECGGAVVDLAFVIDSSESVGAANWGVLINFVGAVISAADVNDGKTRVAVEVYR